VGILHVQHQGFHGDKHRGRIEAPTGHSGRRGGFRFHGDKHRGRIEAPISPTNTATRSAAVSTVINTVAELKPEGGRDHRPDAGGVSTVINTVAELKHDHAMSNQGGFQSGFHGDKHRGRIEAKGDLVALLRLLRFPR